MRDPKLDPYSPDEARVAKWISDKGIGGGDDPIGFILSSYDYVVFERNKATDALREILAIEDEMFGGDWEEITKARAIAAAALGESK